LLFLTEKQYVYIYSFFYENKRKTTRWKRWKIKGFFLEIKKNKKKMKNDLDEKTTFSTKVVFLWNPKVFPRSYVCKEL